MAESNRPALSPLFTWRSAVCESDLTPTVRHVALTLSLYMNERGGSAFPGATRLAHDTGLHEDTIRRSLAHLAEGGWLVLVERGGRKGERRTANAYVASIPPPAEDRGLEEAPPAQDRTTPRTGSPQDVIEVVKDSCAEQARTHKRARDPLWDALIEACGFTHVTPTPPERGAWNKALKDIRAAGATPELVHERARAYRKTWPNVRLTPSALARHWGSLGADEPDSDTDVLSAYGLTRG